MQNFLLRRTNRNHCDCNLKKMFFSEDKKANFPCLSKATTFYNQFSSSSEKQQEDNSKRSEANTKTWKFDFDLIDLPQAAIFH